MNCPHGNIGLHRFQCKGYVCEHGERHEICPECNTSQKCKHGNDKKCWQCHQAKKFGQDPVSQFDQLFQDLPDQRTAHIDNFLAKLGELSDAELRMVKLKLFGEERARRMSQRSVTRRDFAVGDKVYFKTRRGITLYGIILKKNPVNFKVQPHANRDGVWTKVGRAWNVSPSLLRHQEKM